MLNLFVTLRWTLAAILTAHAALSVPAPPELRAQAATASAGRPPNVVLVLADDLGFADLGSYGAAPGLTPRLDRLAAEGLRFTSFYVSNAVCSASRAALLTGSYATRLSIHGAFMPDAKVGLHPDEITIAEMLKAQGYATGAFGKWHLGHLPAFLPRAQGFDEYFGIPYSNDMWPRHPTIRGMPPLPLIEGTTTIAHDPDQSRLTGELTARAVGFIERHRARPFFLYLAHPMPHVPLHAGERFRGLTGRGLYADVVAEIDASTGAILDALDRWDLAARTVVIFTSDNGPWLSYGDHAGSAGPFREGKGTTFEGGVRVPAIMRWPGQFTPGRVVPELVAAFDLLPTLAAATAAGIPAGPAIDGRNLLPLLRGEPGAAVRDTFFYYYNAELRGVRQGRWKLHLPHTYQALEATGRDGLPGRYVQRQIGTALYDLEADPGESRDLAAGHPQVVSRLQEIAERARADLGDRLTGRTGASVRPVGRDAGETRP